MQLFAQLRKVDEEKRLVFGRIAEEAVDKAGEIMDYAKSKPHFVAWSEEVAKDSGGASLGNVRAMHGKVAAGKLTQIDFDDASKAIDVCAKVVDDGEWKKVLEGVYTGFSIGGSYVGEKTVEKVNGQDATRYVAKPSEVSLVDRPCMPGARFFEVQKADGSLAKVDFQAQPEPVLEKAEEEPLIEGTPEQVAELCRVMKAQGMNLAQLIEKVASKNAAATSTDPDGDGDAAEDTDDDGDGGKKPAAEKAEPAADLAKAEPAVQDEAEASLGKLEAALTDTLAKIGARNSKVDSARIAKIHDMAVELGAMCGTAKAEPQADLQKVVAEAMAPLQKSLDEALAKVAKLEAQPAPPTVRLRAVSKSAEVVTDPLAKEEKPAPVVDATGEAHEAAGLIKSLHRSGGSPLLRK